MSLQVIGAGLGRTGTFTLKTALESDNTAEIASKTQALVQASMKIGEALYGGAPQGAAESESQPGQEGVVDAEFEEVDGKNKKSA